jgi:hypothetical protein
MVDACNPQFLNSIKPPHESLMQKVTRIVYSKNLNRGKYEELSLQAKMLGSLRKEIWHRFGSIRGVGANHRKIRDEWVKSRNFLPLPAKAWKETLRDVLDDISLYEEAAKVKVKEAIAKRTKDLNARLALYRALKSDEWVSDPYLCRKMRKHKKHGKTNVNNQIILENGVYSQFKDKNGQTWLKIPSFSRGKMVVVPLNSNIVLTGCLRLILRDGVVAVHYTIPQKKFRPCGDKIIGVDKGYTEAFADSEGGFHGAALGKVLTEGTEKRHQRGMARNKLYQIAKKKPHKAKNIRRYNLGRKKLTRHYKHQQALIRNIAFQSAHAIVDQACEVRAEDLTRTFASKQKFKKFNRTMSGWAKGSLAEALKVVTKARCSCLRVVNAAYSSQVDSQTNRLEGRRVGDKFYHVSGDVSHADTNAAKNIKRRADDTNIGLYTPHKEVKQILLDRLTATGGVSCVPNSDRPSLTQVARRKRTSTES